jgi:hypothetical protein
VRTIPNWVRWFSYIFQRYATNPVAQSSSFEGIGSILSPSFVKKSGGLGVGMAGAKSDPTKDPAFQSTLKNLLSMKPKPHSEMKVGKKKASKKKKAHKA